MDKGLIYNELLKSIGKINNKKIQTEIESIQRELTEIIKGRVITEIHLDAQEVVFIVHTDYDDMLFSERIIFDDLSQHSFHSYYFVDNFIDRIDYYYLSKIRNV